MAIIERCNLNLRLILRRCLVIRGYKTSVNTDFKEDGDIRRRENDRPEDEREGGYMGGRREGDVYRGKRDGGYFGGRRDGGYFGERRDGGYFGERRDGGYLRERRGGGHFRERRSTDLYGGREDRSFIKSSEGFDAGFIDENKWTKKMNVQLDNIEKTAGAKLVEQPVTVECGDIEYKTWSKFTEIECLDYRLKEILLHMGHDEMSCIQKHTFDILNRHVLDILGSAETGSGKTLAFLTPIINSILSSYPKNMMEELKNSSVQTPLMLVVAPTRELVQQINQEARILTHLTPLRVCNVIGGVNITSQISNISNGCHSIIATPGRLIDLLKRNCLSLKYCTNIVLDEADRMLDMGFEPQIREIVSAFDLPQINLRQTSMFSATFPKDVMIMARTLLKKSYGRVMVGNNAGSREPTVPESITQSFIVCDQNALFVELFKLLESHPKKTIVFCNMKREVEEVERFARKKNVHVSTVYGDLSQRRRDEQLHAFKSNKIQILVATSVAARGLDVADVERVINLGIPISCDEYVHRVGRCGRMGREGTAITLATWHQLQQGTMVRDLVKILKQTNQIVPDFFANNMTGKKRDDFNRQSNFSQGRKRGWDDEDDF